MVGKCTEFVTFHGLKFNKNKCEYMVLNQGDDRDEGDEYAKWELPKWPNGEDIQPKIRKVEHYTRWKAEHAEILEQIKLYEGSCLDMNEGSKVTKQPSKESIIKVKVKIHKWETEIEKEESDEKATEKAQNTVKAALNRIKQDAFGQEGEEQIRESTNEWMETMRQWIGLKKAHRTSIDKATRYLGVYFNMGLSWKTQIEVLQAKFEGMYDRISHSKPSADMAVYCINAVINAALKWQLYHYKWQLYPRAH